MDQQIIKAALDWQAAMGADEATGNAPTDWAGFAPPAWWDELKGIPVKGTAPAPAPPAATVTALHAAPLSPPAPSPTPMFTTPAAVTVAAQTLADLAAEFQAFDGIGLKKTALNFVFGEGNPAKRIMLIGEGPGADEDKAGRPFVGRSGQLLDRMLAAIGLASRDDYYITNVSPWRPPGNRTPTDVEVAMLRPFLLRHIELVKPAVIVTIGGLAAKALLNHKDGITKLRGKFLSFQADEAAPAIPLLPLLHPAWLLRNPIQKAPMWADLLQLKEHLRNNNLLV